MKLALKLSITAAIIWAVASMAVQSVLCPEMGFCELIEHVPQAMILTFEE